MFCYMRWKASYCSSYWIGYRYACCLCIITTVQCKCFLIYTGLEWSKWKLFWQTEASELKAVTAWVHTALPGKWSICNKQVWSIGAVSSVPTFTPNHVCKWYLAISPLADHYSRKQATTAERNSVPLWDTICASICLQSVF